MLRLAAGAYASYITLPALDETGWQFLCQIPVSLTGSLTAAHSAVDLYALGRDLACWLPRHTRTQAAVLLQAALRIDLMAACPDRDSTQGLHSVPHGTCRLYPLWLYLSDAIQLELHAAPRLNLDWIQVGHEVSSSQLDLACGRLGESGPIRLSYAKAFDAHLQVPEERYPVGHPHHGWCCGSGDSVHAAVLQECAPPF